MISCLAVVADASPRAESCHSFVAYGLVFSLTPQSERGGHISIGQSFNTKDEDTVTPEMVARALTVCLVSAVVILLLGVLNLSNTIYTRIPAAVKNAMPVGLGLLFALNGFQQMV